MNTTEILKLEDLEELTGAKQASKQAEVLTRNGIYYIERLDRSIVTTWYHVNHPTTFGASNDQPDFSKVG